MTRYSALNLSSNRSRFNNLGSPGGYQSGVGLFFFSVALFLLTPTISFHVYITFTYLYIFIMRKDYYLYCRRQPRPKKTALEDFSFAY